MTGFCHSRVPSKGGTEVHCHSGDSFLSVSLMLLLGSCIFTKIPALLDCGYIPTGAIFSKIFLFECVFLLIMKLRSEIKPSRLFFRQFVPSFQVLRDQGGL